MIKQVVIYAKDVAKITGKSTRTARRILASIRLLLSKAQSQPVTVTEFCQFMGMDEDEVRSHMTP